jgi:hypothetical protein
MVKLSLGCSAHYRYRLHGLTLDENFYKLLMTELSQELGFLFFTADLIRCSVDEAY